MAYNAHVLQVLIASPSDVSQERDLACRLIDEWNSTHGRRSGVLLQALRWETDATPDLTEDAQGVINRQLVDNCDAVVGIFWTKLGKATPRASSGTAEEIERCRSQGKRCLIYFSDTPTSPSGIDPAQMEALKVYKKEIQSNGLYSAYRSTDEFRDQLRRALAEVAQGFIEAEARKRVSEEKASLALEAARFSPGSNPMEGGEDDDSMETLRDAQRLVMKLADSRFGLEELKELVDQQAGAIGFLTNSPVMSGLFGSPPSPETVQAVVKTYEEAMRASMNFAAALGKYDNGWAGGVAEEWLGELLWTEPQSGYVWADKIRHYPALLLVYAFGLAQIAASKTALLDKLLSSHMYDRATREAVNVLGPLHPGFIFEGDKGQWIEPGRGNRFTPVSDHLCTLTHKMLFSNTRKGRFEGWFDLFEFLISLKAASLREIPAFGSYGWRQDHHWLIAKAVQDAALGKGELGKGLLSMFGGEEGLRAVAENYDKRASQIKGYSRFSPLPVVAALIDSAKKGKRVTNLREFAREQGINVW